MPWIMIVTLACFAAIDLFACDILTLDDTNGDGINDIAISEMERIWIFDCKADEFGPPILPEEEGLLHLRVLDAEGGPLVVGTWRRSLLAYDLKGRRRLSLELPDPGVLAATVSDLNSDGHGELLVLGAGDQRVDLTALSGKDGCPIWRFNQESDDPSLHLYSVMTDQNLSADDDGIPDLVLARAHSVADRCSVELVLLSGKTGGALVTHDVKVQSADHAPRLTRLGDVDGDGITDLGFSVPSSMGDPIGVLVAVSLGKGTRLFEVEIDGEIDSLSTVEDVSGDGKPDLVLGGIGWHERVEVRSGATGDVLYTLDRSWDGPELSFGTKAASIGDFDGDSVSDFVLASKDLYDESGEGWFDVISGRDGRTLISRSRSDLVR